MNLRMCLSPFRLQKTGPVTEVQNSLSWDSFVGGKCKPFTVFGLVYSTGIFCCYNQTWKVRMVKKSWSTWVCLFMWQPHDPFQSYLGTINTCFQTSVSLINPNWEISFSKYFYNRTKQKCLMALIENANTIDPCVHSELKLSSMLPCVV